MNFRLAAVSLLFRGLSGSDRAFAMPRENSENYSSQKQFSQTKSSSYAVPPQAGHSISLPRHWGTEAQKKSL